MTRDQSLLHQLFRGRWQRTSVQGWFIFNQTGNQLKVTTYQLEANETHIEVICIDALKNQLKQFKLRMLACILNYPQTT